MIRKIFNTNMLLHATRKICQKCAILLFLMSLFAIRCFAGDCFIGRSSFAVVEPYLIEKVCYLYAHETRMYRDGKNPADSEFVTSMGTNDLHPDQLHREFVQMRLDKKFLALSAGTQVFNCQYDIEVIKRDREEAKLKGFMMPEFNCRGITYQMVPIRLVNSNTCYWVAEVQVRCEEQVRYKLTPFDLFEEELRD